MVKSLRQNINRNVKNATGISRPAKNSLFSFLGSLSSEASIRQFLPHVSNSNRIALSSLNSII